MPTSDRFLTKSNGCGDCTRVLRRGGVWDWRTNPNSPTQRTTCLSSADEPNAGHETDRVRHRRWSILDVTCSNESLGPVSPGKNGAGNEPQLFALSYSLARYAACGCSAPRSYKSVFKTADVVSMQTALIAGSYRRWRPG